MTSDHDMLDEIERHEQWLRTAGVEVELPPGLGDRVKQRMRVAIDEAWLVERNVELPSADALAGVKARVRLELTTKESQPVTTLPWSAGRVYRLVGTWSAAAALLLAAGLGLWATFSSPDPTAGDGIVDNLATALSRDLDEDEVEWDALDAELTELEAMLAQGVELDWGDPVLDELNDEVDELMADFGLPSEVS